MKIGIAGAGLVGRLAAWRLVKLGHSVSLFEKDDPLENPEKTDAAAFTAAGMVTPFSESDIAEPEVIDRGIRSLPKWRAIVEELNCHTAINDRGSILLAHPQDAQELELFKRKTDRYRSAFNDLDANGLKMLEPELAGFSNGIFSKNEFSLIPEKILHCLLEESMSLGVKLRSRDTVLTVSGGLVETLRERYQFDKVIDCRGLGAKPELTSLRGVRGEVILLRAPEVKINRTVRLLHPRQNIYLVPRGKGLYVVGATQIESESRNHVSVRSAMELLSGAYSIHRSFSEAEILHLKQNCRPAFSHNRPEIIREKNCIRINGLFRHGFLMAPDLVDELLSIVEEEADCGNLV